eukprot:Pgem_evm1s11452
MNPDLKHINSEGSHRVSLLSNASFISHDNTQRKRKHTKFKPTKLTHGSTEVTCKFCDQLQATVVLTKATKQTLMMSALYSLVCCCCIPAMSNKYKTKVHYCAKCNAKLGKEGDMIYFN